MWITQSYLGKVEPDAKVFVYYMYRDYIDEEKKFTQCLQKKLENLGDVFGEKVCLSMPNPRYTGRIEAEVRENRPLWEAIHPWLPGLLLSTKPLTQVERDDDTCFFVPFGEPPNAPAIEAAVQKIKTLADEAIVWGYHAQENSPVCSFMNRVINAVELKPGVAGFRIDLRRIFQR